jgi:AraC family transcriptional regulator
MPATSERTLYDSPGLRLGEFRCAPDDRRWRETNSIGAEAHVVFPQTAVVIHHEGGGPVLANRNHVMFYNAGQAYRRTLRDGAGDRSIFVALDRATLAELLAAARPAGTSTPAGLPFAHGPSHEPAYLGHRLLVRHLASRGAPDRLAVDEALGALLVQSVADAFAVHARTRGRSRTGTDHARLVEEAKALLADRAGERLGLEDVARVLNTSRFHLARVFRRETGFSLHRYRNALRLRAAVERIESGEADLARLAADLGYASHSHFTDAFRRAFGRPPSALRGPGAASARELRTSTEAVLAVRP